MDCKAELGQTYLATRYFINGKADGYIDVTPNTVIAVKGSLCTKSRNEFQPVRTDKYGRIAWAKASLDFGKPIQSLSSEQEIIIPPTDVLSYVSTLHGELWNDELAKLLENYQGRSIKISRERISFDYIRPPINKPSLDLNQRKKEELYREWYKKLNGADIFGFVMPRLRAVFFIFSSDQFLGGDVFFYRGGSAPSDLNQAEIKKIEGTNKFVAIYVDSDNRLEADELYCIKVVPRNTSMIGLWQEKLINDVNVPYYQLSKPFHFNITNPLGEFEIVNCEPVTVEELMITQFPKQFSHLIEAAKNLNTETPHNSPSKQTKKQNKPTDGLIPFAQQLETNREYAHMATGALLSPDRLKTGLAVGKLIDDFTKERQSDSLKALAEMTFGGTSTWAAWKDVREAIKNDIISAQKAVPFSQLIKENWFSSNAYKNLSGDIKDLENTMVYRVKGSANLVALIDKFAKPFDIVHSGYGVTGGAMSHQQLNEDTDITIEKLSDLFQQYHDKIGRYEHDENSQNSQACELKVMYGLNESSIKSQYHAQLLQFSERLKADETLSVALQGHTDNIGTDEFNYQLSLDRANTVREYLIGQGINKKRLFIVANGESSPASTNNSENGREANRRVEAFIQRGEKLASYSYCREAVGNIERLRNLSNDQLIRKSDVIDQGLNSLIDTVLAVASCVPVTSLAALTLVAFKTGVGALSSAAEFFDQQLGSRARLQFKDSTSLVRNLEAHSMVNQKLIRDIPFGELNSPAHYLHLQYRIRSEALTGLMLIITRALVYANSPDLLDKQLPELDGIDWNNEDQAAKGREILFKLKLEKYCVNEYVQTMLLNDQWMFPLKPLAPVGMDTYWIYNKASYQQVDESIGHSLFNIALAIKETFSDASPEKIVNHGIDELVRDASHFYSLLDADLPGHARADFHRCFPVHHLASTDISQFCQVFKTAYPELSKNYLAHTAIHFKGSSSLSDWQPMAKRFVKDPYSEHISIKPLSPMQALRILVVLKDEYIDGVYPIRLQLCRQDTAPDIQGPVYTDITRELKADELLSDEQQFAGKRGCIFYPFYKLGQSTLFGAKPLGSYLGLKGIGADRYYHWGNLEADNVFKVCIGKNKSLEKTIRFALFDKGDEWADDARGHSKYWKQHSSDIDYREAFPTRVDTKRPHEALMINEDFLLDRSSSIQLPPLFDRAGYQNVAVLARIPDAKGEGEWLLPHPSFAQKIEAASKQTGIDISLEGQRAISFNQYDWHAPIEFMMLVMVSSLKDERYDDLKQDWKQFSLDFELEEYNRLFKNTPGPKITKTMHYLGEMQQVRKDYYLEKNATSIIFKPASSVHVKSHPALSQALSLFENNTIPKWRQQIEALAGWFSPSEHEGNKRHVFAVHYVPEYESPTGNMVRGLRPFGEDRVDLIESIPPKLQTNDDDAYRYQFGGFRTPGQTGFSCDNATRHVTPNNSLPYEFRFSVPKSYDGDAPWMKEPENPKDSILKQSAIKGPEAEKESYLAKLNAIKKWIEKDTRSIRIDRNVLY